MFDIKDIEKYSKYPVRLSESEGDNLAKIFAEKPIGKTTLRKFFYDYNDYRYFLLEELLIEENIAFDEPKKDHLHIIGRNFFLDREKL